MKKVAFFFIHLHNLYQILLVHNNSNKSLSMGIQLEKVSVIQPQLILVR